MTRQRLRRSLVAQLPLAACLAVAALCSVPWRGAAGQGGQPSPSLGGRWQLQGSAQQAQVAVQQAVDPALAAMRPDMQRLARARIAETTWIPSTIRIEAAAQRILVEYQGSENRTFDTPPGQPQNVYSRSGVRAQMTQNFRPDGGIEQRFVALDGTQYNILAADPSGRQLTLDVLMQSQRLAQDIRFRVAYARAR